MKKIKFLYSLIILLLSINVSFSSDNSIFDVPKEIKDLSPKKLRDMAISGDATAKFWLGECCNSYETKAKKKEAEKWWHEAAIQNHPGAIERLISAPKPQPIVMEVSEDVRERFHNRHLELYEQAKKQNAEAIFSIGNLYEKGEGDLYHDGARAIKYWKKSARLGYKDAIEKIHSLNLKKLE